MPIHKQLRQRASLRDFGVTTVKAPPPSSQSVTAAAVPPQSAALVAAATSSTALSSRDAQDPNGSSRTTNFQSAPSLPQKPFAKNSSSAAAVATTAAARRESAAVPCHKSHRNHKKQKQKQSSLSGTAMMTQQQQQQSAGEDEQRPKRSPTPPLPRQQLMHAGEPSSSFPSHASSSSSPLPCATAAAPAKTQTAPPLESDGESFETCPEQQANGSHAVAAAAAAAQPENDDEEDYESAQMDDETTASPPVNETKLRAKTLESWSPETASTAASRPGQERPPPSRHSLFIGETGENVDSDSDDEDDSVMMEEEEEEPETPSRTRRPGRSGDADSVQVGCRVAIYWPGEKSYFTGLVTQEGRERRSAQRRFFVEYDDGDTEWIDFSTDQFRILSSPEEEESPDNPPRRKRGRPRKNSLERTPGRPQKRDSSIDPPRRKRGRQRREDSQEPRRKRGRPRREDSNKPVREREEQGNGEVPVKRGRGRPRKHPIVEANDRSEETPAWISKMQEEPGSSSKNSLVADPPVKRGPGRPRKFPRLEEVTQEDEKSPQEFVPDEVPSGMAPPRMKRGRGRPRKVPRVEHDAGKPSIESQSEPVPENSPSGNFSVKEKRGPGRPRKVPLVQDAIKDDIADDDSPALDESKVMAMKEELAVNVEHTPKRGPGRPRKVPLVQDAIKDDSAAADADDTSTLDAMEELVASVENKPKRGPGRPRKVPRVHAQDKAELDLSQEGAVLEEEQEAKIKRGPGRPRKVPRVKVTSKDERSGDKRTSDSQEEELDEEDVVVPKRGRGRPRKEPVLQEFKKDDGISVKQAWLDRMTVRNRIGVYWDLDSKYYSATVVKIRMARSKPFFIVYDDGEKEWIDLSRHQFRIYDTTMSKEKTVHSPETKKVTSPGNDLEDTDCENDDDDDATEEFTDRRGNPCRVGIGTRLSVYWEEEGQSFKCTVTGIRKNHRKGYHLQYDDEDSEWVNLHKEIFRVLKSNSGLRRVRRRQR